MKRSRLLWLLAAAALIAVGFVFVRSTWDHPAQRAERCSAKAGRTYVEVDLEQARYASLIAAIGTRRGLPARASTIAIATAFQESKMHNIGYGDRDSLGLFQQRPSQGWGTPQEIMDPHYSIGRFFSGLTEVNGYRTMEVTEAAQKVQRSAFGGAYAQHEPSARALASALTGYSHAAFSCQVRTPLNGSADKFHRDVRRAFGPIAHSPSGRAVRYRVPGRRVGWALAQYAVANAKRLAVNSVSYDGRRWTAKDSPDGWVKVSGSRKRGMRRVRVQLG